MTGIVVTGWSTVNSTGVGVEALARHFSPDGEPRGQTAGTARVSELFPEPLPAATGHALTDFDVRAHLGRKGTSSYDRTTALSVVCCQQALAAAGMTLTDASRARVGVALGTSLGSFKSTSDFSRDTLIQEKPYLVNPVLFPNTVMNCAAGQVAIRFGLRGTNATIAGGHLAFLNAMRYASNIIERGYADAMLTGAVEEFSPHRAWAAHLTGATEHVPAGEGIGVFILTRDPAPEWAGPVRQAQILAVDTGYGPGGGSSGAAALERCVRRSLHRAGVDAAAVSTVVTGEATDADDREFGPVVAALGRRPERILVQRLLGACDAANGALALAVLLASRPRTDRLALLTARGPDGAAGAAVVRVLGDDDADRG